MYPKKTLTLSNGAPTPGDDHSLTIGPNGPILVQDVAMIDKLADFDRERIPERVVHAKGYGFHGFFELTHDLSKYTKADFLSGKGKKTPIFARFSTVAGEKGSADTVRDPRGFAVKFYTTEGNYDMVGNNTPVFFINDGIKFPDFIHTQKRDPKSNLHDPTFQTSFWSHRPESVHQVVWLMGPRGLPASLHEMNGYSGHAYKFINKQGEYCFFKWHFKAREGVRNMDQSTGDETAGKDPDFHQREMFNYLESGKQATWDVFVQIMTAEQAKKMQYNPFDISLVWKHGDFPLLPVGTMVLNRNPLNYFAEVEQSAFAPTNMVPGIEPSPDKMLQVRLFSYPDTHRYRLGRNFHQIPINAPYRTKVFNNSRDGAANVNGNQGDLPNYYPNHFVPTQSGNAEQEEHFSGNIVRKSTWPVDEHFNQARRLYEDIFSDADRKSCSDNFAGFLKGVRSDKVVLQYVKLLNSASKKLALTVASKLNIDPSQL